MENLIFFCNGDFEAPDCQEIAFPVKALKDPVAGAEGWEKGAKRREIRRTDSSATLQTANLGKAQWFVVGFIGELLERE